MFLKYFKKKQNQNSDLYNCLYIDIIDSTKLITFKILKIKNVDFVVTFEVITIILFFTFNMSILFAQKINNIVVLGN